MSSRSGETTGVDRTTSGRKDRSDCPECGGALVTDGGAETTCSSCGLVARTDRLDRGPEWRAFDAEQRDARRRVGAPRTELRHDRGLSTTIASGNRDAYGNALSARQRQKMQRLRQWDRRFQTDSAKERNLRQALGEVDRMGSALGLPDDVRETAAVVYRRALEADLVFGRSIEGVASAAVYAAARQTGTPRSLDEVATVSRVEKLEITRTYRNVVRELGLGVDLADPAAYLRRYASELDASPGAERRAHALLEAGQDAGVHVGKSPTGLAAAALYAGERLTGGTTTQADVCAVADVCQVTVRNRYQELLAAFEEGDGEPELEEGDGEPELEEGDGEPELEEGNGEPELAEGDRGHELEPDGAEHELEPTA